MDETASKTLTIEECAAVLRLSRGSTYEAARTGQIPTIRIGRRLLVPRARLMQMLGEGDVPEESVG
jgi:excisionase family DNA binding protein